MRTRRGIATATIVVVGAIAGAAGSSRTGVGDALLGALIAGVVAFVLVAVLARTWEQRTHPATPSFARRTPAAADRASIRIDRNAEVWTDRQGFLFERREWFVATCCPPRRVDNWEASSAEDDTPIYVTKNGPRRWWYWRGSFYWATDEYDGQDVRALLLERERRDRRRLEHAHTMMRVEDGYLDDPNPAESDTRKRRPIPEDVKRFVFERDGGRCVSCGSTMLLQFDHDIPVAMGGSDEPENLQLLCADCNRKKGATLA